MTIGVAIATFGDQDVWVPLGQRAWASVQAQTRPADACEWVHADTLHDARNLAVSALGTEWVVCLDADDELDARYLEAVAATVARLDGGDWLLQPATLGVVDGRADPQPVVIPAKTSLLDGNWLVIGTAFRAEQFERVGGFRDLPAYEDWDLFVRMWLDGAQPHAVADAVYRVHVRAGSRNDLSRLDAQRLYARLRGEYQQMASERGTR